MSKWKEMHKEAPPPEPEKVPTLEEVEQSFSEQLDVDQKDEFLQQLNASRDKEKKYLKDISDTNYYFTVCFSNKAQLYEFCEKFGLNPDLIHMDGREVAKQFRKALETPDLRHPSKMRKSKDYEDLALDFPE